jgi:hypothetical protein
VGRSRRRDPDAPAPAEAAEAAAAQPNARERFMAHTPQYRFALVVWIGSIFLIPASVLLKAPLATGVAIVLTWLAIHNLRRVDARERRARAEAAPTGAGADDTGPDDAGPDDTGSGAADPDPPSDRATSAGTTPR